MTQKGGIENAEGRDIIEGRDDADVGHDRREG